jgi:hypothetical protein
MRDALPRPRFESYVAYDAERAAQDIATPKLLEPVTNS